VLEVGSAPGHNLVRLHERFGLIPYGVEYSDSGYELNRRLFEACCLDTANVVKADFFSESFQAEYKNFFDVVLSFGFIEHFDEVGHVVEKHLNVLAKNGLLIIAIPNLRGLNRLLQRFFDSDVLAMHNLEVMDKERFAALFQSLQLTPLFCDHYGTINFGLFVTRKTSPIRKVILVSLKILQLLLNWLLRLFLGSRNVECRFISPYLLYIGVKADG